MYQVFTFIYGKVVTCTECLLLQTSLALKTKFQTKFLKTKICVKSMQVKTRAWYLTLTLKRESHLVVLNLHLF